jgi:hypothetical protein
MPDRAGYPGVGVPRWLKISGIVVGVLVLIMLLSGHGPWPHMHGGDMPSASIMQGPTGNLTPPKGNP